MGTLSLARKCGLAHKLTVVLGRHSANIEIYLAGATLSMTDTTVAFGGGRIFDGHRLHDDHVIRFKSGQVELLCPRSDFKDEGCVIDLKGDILSPAYADLQVNGGGGVMLNDDPSLATLKRIAAAHRTLGTAVILPTLITDTGQKTKAAIEAAIEAIDEATPGIAGLHLEGPHLSQARKGVHDGNLIRPMEAAYLNLLLQAAAKLPILMVTIAPESTSVDQVEQLARAGVIVSLGHTDADFDTCIRYMDAGASCVTHLFNAMSQLGSRTPGLVGAALARADVSAGLIADGIHVHPESLRIAWSAKRQAEGAMYLVSDAMAVAGTDMTGFDLGGRRIERANQRLTLAGVTLAGADLDLTRAIYLLVHEAGVPLEDALSAATSVPRKLLGQNTDLRIGASIEPSDLIRISPDLKTVRWALDT